MADTIGGACLCGGVTFELAARPSYVVHCHCTMCRRAHGAGVVTWASFPVSALRLTAGADRLVDYHSSAEAVRRFCGVCGASLFFESRKWPGQLDVALANLTAPLAEQPMMHVWWNEHVPWLELGDDLPRRDDPTAT